MKINMFCTFCGTKVGDADNFCQACGNNLKQEVKTLPQGSKSFQETGYVEPIKFVETDFTVQQKIFAFRDTYKVKDSFGNEFMIVRKEWFSIFRPKLWVENMNGEIIGSIQGNFWRTRFEICDNQGRTHAIVHFPLIMIFRKHFDIETSSGWYSSGNSVFGYRFDAYDQQGNQAFLVDKKVFTIRDQFQIRSFGNLSPFITCLGAVCIDQKFHDKGGSGNSLLNFVN